MKHILVMIALVYSSLGLACNIKANCGIIRSVKESSISRLMLPLGVPAIKLKLKNASTFISCSEGAQPTQNDIGTHTQKYLYIGGEKLQDHMLILKSALETSREHKRPMFVCLGNYVNGVVNKSIVSVSSTSNEDAFQQLQLEN
jgi:hypothetical protein